MDGLIAGGFIAAALAIDVGKTLIGAPAKRASELVKQQVAGMTPAQITGLESKAEEVERKNPSVGTTNVQHMIRNLQSITGSYEDAMAVIEPLAKLRVIAQSKRPGEDIAEDVDLLVKGLEIKGVAQNPKEFKEYMDGIAKGLNALGDTVKPYQYYEMQKYGRQATPTLDIDFILGAAPAVAQEMGGSSFGKAVASFNRQAIGGVM